MLESFLTIPLHFAVEFLGFLIMAGGAFLVLFRPALVPGGAANRVAVAAGFLALAAAQVLHGGSFIPADGDSVLVALQMLGLVLIVVGVSGGLRAAPGAAAFAIREPLLLAPAGAAGLLAVVSFLGSRRGGTHHLRRLALSALLFAVAAVLTASAPDVRVDDPPIGGVLIAAHLARAGAYGSLAWWLWTGVRLSIRTRFVASFVTLLVLVVVALSAALTAVITENIERDELSRVVDQNVNAVRGIEEDTASAVSDDVLQLTEESFTQTQLAARSEDQLSGTAESIVQRRLFEFDFVVFTTPTGEILGRAGFGPATLLPEEGSNVVQRPLDEVDYLTIVESPVVQSVIEGPFSEAASPDRFDVQGNSSSAVMAAARVPDAVNPDRVAGLVVAGRFLDQRTVANISRSTAPSRASLIVGGRLAFTSLPGTPELRELFPRSLRSGVQAGAGASSVVTLGDDSYFTAYEGINSENAAVVATLALSSPARIVNAARQGITRTLFLVALGVALIALVLAWLSGRRITRPIQQLTMTAVAIREGNLAASAEVAGNDEVGQLGETFNEMTKSLRRMTGDLREAAREEQRLRARIETIIESMADGLVAVDARRMILAFNREAENMTGLQSRRVIGRPVDKVLAFTNAQGESVTAPISRLAEGSIGGIYLMRKDKKLPVAVTCAVLHGEDDEVTGGVAVIRDITRERELERMKSAFLANVSHELRTPLTPIKGYAELLGRRRVPADKTRQLAREILESTERLERIVELLVDFSALEGGRLAPRARPVNMALLANDLVRDWSERHPRHRIVANVGKRLPKVAGDDRLLRRSIEELLDNAVKFSPNGGTITLAVKGTRSTNGAKANRSVAVAVSDEGIGIAPENLSRIFADFQQLDGSETRTFGGLGLGLAFVQRIVEAHDGRVSVDSKLDIGTTLTITLPAQPAN